MNKTGTMTRVLALPIAGLKLFLYIHHLKLHVLSIKILMLFDLTGVHVDQVAHFVSYNYRCQIFITN